MPPKSIFRQPGAQHFQLVHRSQRDPLINDPNASQHVLKPFERENVKKGKSRVELEDILARSDSDHRANVGEAAMYGVLFDDTGYDYMQHLRQVGIQEDGVESILIEAPLKKARAKAKGEGHVLLRDLPSNVLPSSVELPRDYESEEAIPSSISGIQPDMDPHLRQVLEALEDDAFVDDDLQDNFFQELVTEGERELDDHVEFEFHDDVNTEEGAITAGGEEVLDTWEARFERFKKEQKDLKPTGDSDSDVDAQSEEDDTVSGLPAASVIGGRRRRRKGTSDASGYSMSSSSLYRTDALKTLDGRFDQMMLREYAENDDEDDEYKHASSDDSDAVPDLLTSREDFGSMVDDFLDNYEILGSKMKPKLEGDTGADKLGILRATLGQDERIRFRDEDSDGEHDLLQFEDDDEKDRWDCETILTTYSNLENHPRLIRARDSGIVRKIRLDPRTGLPTEPGQKSPNTGDAKIRTEIDDERYPAVRIPVIRPRGETQEEKKARKQLVKDERQSRRMHKKATKNQYSTELKQQRNVVVNTEKPKMRKL